MGVASVTSVSKVDLVWQAMTGANKGKGLKYLLKSVDPILTNMSAQERIQLAEHSVTQSAGQRSLVARFLLLHLLKTHLEDPVHGLTGEQLFPVFKNFGAEAVAILAQEHKRFFPVLTQNQISELARVYSERFPGTMQIYGGVFGMSDAQKTTLFMELARRNGSIVLRQSWLGTDPDYSDRQRRFSGFFPIDFPGSATKRVLRMALAYDGLRVLQSGSLRDTPRIENDTPLEASPGEPSIRGVVELFANRHPELIDPAEARILWDRVKNIEVGFRILSEMAKLAERGFPRPHTSLEALSLALGYDAHAIDAAKLSDRQTNQLYEISLDLSLNLDKPPFKGITIDPSVWQPKQIKNFLDLLGSLRDLTHMYGNNQRAWERVLSEIDIRGLRLDSVTVAELNTRVRETLASFLENAFKGSDVTVTRGELDSLYNRWGSIEIITTLIARFRGNEIWRQEIPVLAKVLKAILSGHFLSFKYKGDPKDPEDQEMAKEQLKMLKSDRALVEWMRNRSRIDFYDPNKVDVEGDGDLLSRAKIVVKTNLIPNLRGRAEGSVLEGDAKDKVIASVLGRKTPSPRDLAKIANGADIDVIERTLLRALTEAKDVSTMRKIASYLKGNAPSFGFGHEAQIITDLSSIVLSLVPQERRAPTVVFTTTFDDPKMLLMIGDLVDTSSCQNYRTGSAIETLLGYVMDAGVKGLASYALKPGHFAQQRDYDLLIEAFRAKNNGEQVDIRGDLEADKGIVHLKISRAGQPDIDLKTIPIPKAQLRVVVKVGETDSGGPGVFTERSYEQSHAAIPAMMNHVDQIGREIADAIEGVLGQPITVPPSRNIGGVYSDAAGGSQRHSYRIEPEKTTH